MKVFKAWMSLGLAGFLILAPAAWAVAQDSPDDSIESKIEAILKKDSMLAARSIDVESEQGRVKLTGAVKTADEKARAERLSKIAGVTGVVNELRIDPNVERSTADRAASATKEGLNKAVDATAKGAEKAAQGAKRGVAEAEKGVATAAGKTADAVGTAGEKLTDSSISTRVKHEFSEDATLKNAAIRVETKARVVTLRGTVATADIKARAEDVAAKTDGVTRVVNELLVKQ